MRTSLLLPHPPLIHGRSTGSRCAAPRPRSRRRAPLGRGHPAAPPGRTAPSSCGHLFSRVAAPLRRRRTRLPAHSGSRCAAAPSNAAAASRGSHSLARPLVTCGPLVGCRPVCATATSLARAHALATQLYSHAQPHGCSHHVPWPLCMRVPALVALPMAPEAPWPRSLFHEIRSEIPLVLSLTEIV